MLYQILISSFVVSLISLIGVVILSKKIKRENKILFVLIAFAAGAMLGNAFFHILPESLEEITPLNFSIIFLTGFISFFVIEKITHWRHCHDGHCEEHSTKTVGYLNLIGDGFHNFLDGVLIAVSYLASFEIGLATTIAVASHEIPQELGDFSVLIFSGFSRAKAIFYNFLSALLAVIGALAGFFLLKSTNYIPYVLPLVAGSLVYIATTDLVPELHKEWKVKYSILMLLSFIFGLFVLYALKVWV